MSYFFAIFAPSFKIKCMFIDEDDNRSIDEILKDAEFPDDYDAFEDENLEMIP